MVGYEEIILSVLGIVGTGGIITACVTYVLDKRKQIEFRLQEYKESRYKAIILQMLAVIKPNDLGKLSQYRPDLTSTDEVRNEVETEWYNCLLFASDNVIKSLKEFIKEPNDLTYAKTVFAMRGDCWNKRTNLKAEETYL
jgi:hypothetical protein